MKMVQIEMRAFHSSKVSYRVGWVKNSYKVKIGNFVELFDESVWEITAIFKKEQRDNINSDWIVGGMINRTREEKKER